MKYVNIYTVADVESNNNAEVVELVYGTSLENWRRFIAYRGFESHPLRHFFIYGDLPKWLKGTVC